MGLKTKYILILLFLIVLSPIVAFSQYDQDMTRAEEEETDKKETDKIVEPKIGIWYLQAYGAFQDSAKIDTLQDYFHLFNPIYKNALTTTYLGNYGTPSMNNNFFERDSELDFFFLKSREAYLLTPDKIQYYNTRTPYTRMDYSQSENKNKKNETRFNVFHSQNASPYLNFSFRFDQAKSQGQYNAQETKVNSVSLYSSYNKDNLNIYSGFISNAIKNGENGGIAKDGLILENIESEFLDVNLNSSQSNFNSSYFFANGEYSFGKYTEKEDGENDYRPIIGLLYSFTYQRHKQEFIEEEDAGNEFFENTYFGDEYFKDSIRFNEVSNVFQLKQYENTYKKVSFGKRAFLGHEVIHASSPGIIPVVYTKFGEQIDHVDINENRTPAQIFRNSDSYSNVYVGGGIFRETGEFWTWNFDGKFYLLGRNIGQTELNGVIAKPFLFLRDSLASIVIKGTIENRVADIFQEEFYSNHVKWKNNFNMEQRLVAKGSFISPKRKLEIGGNYALITNFIYNNSEGIPTQTNKELLLFSGFLDKDFNYRKLHFRTRLLWQKASNENFIHLPEFSTFVSAYYKFVLSKVLFSQLGVDTRYNTSYYADAYSPSTGLFHIQNEKKYGNFPYIDVYISARLKRTRLFFKVMNVGANFINQEYFTAAHYPMYRSTYRFGVSWVFYD